MNIGAFVPITGNSYSVCRPKNNLYGPVTHSRTGSMYIAEYKNIVSFVAKSPVCQILETDCTQERTCNEYGPVATNKERT